MSEIPAAIFKAYDIRGIVGRTLTPEGVRLLGQAIGSEALDRGNNTIVIGRDGRLSGPDMRDALTDGLLSTGIDVIDLGMVPTPLVYFATWHLNTGTSVSITGSHNPPDYNGFKVMIGGDTLSGKAIQALRQRILNDDFRSGKGQKSDQSINADYLARVTGDIKLKRPFKIVVDCGNGIAGAVAPELFSALGCEVVELFTEVDGTFPNHHPDPIDEKNLVDLKQSVKQHNADLGLAFDGDGDRLGVVTPSGVTVWPDRQMILFARDVLSRQPGAEIIFDVKCTQTLPAAIEAAGGIATMYKTGHSLIKAKLQTSDAALAGEMSGHIFFKERWYGFDDGLYAGARLLELLSSLDESPETVFSKLPDTVNTPELRLELNEGEQHQLIEDLVGEVTEFSGETATIDGLRVDYPFGFGLARASNTTPTVIMRFEADTEDNLAVIQNEFKTAFGKVRDQLTLPF